MSRHLWASARRQARAADAFNEAHPVGTPVRVWTGVREGAGIETVTTSPAEVLSGHTAVVWCANVSGCIALSHVEVIQSTGRAV